MSSASLEPRPAEIFRLAGRILRASRDKKMRPGVSPAPRRWVMVGCLQGRRWEDAPARVNKALTVWAKLEKSSSADKKRAGPTRIASGVAAPTMIRVSIRQTVVEATPGVI